MSGDDYLPHLSLKQQHELIKTLVRSSRRGEWDQDAANTLGEYMHEHGIRSMALRGYYAEAVDHSLYVTEMPVEEYGLAAVLHIERVGTTPDR